MANSDPCPARERLAELLHHPTLEAGAAALLSHLEHCAACQGAVEELAADAAAWQKAERHLRPLTPQEQAERERWQAHYRPTVPIIASERDSLDFLQPPEREGELGRLGRYAILAEVGRGAMGIVLKARDEGLERIVAIKVMKPALADRAQACQRFLREARAIAAVKHEHVIAIHAVEEKHTPPYLVMEYIAGTSLQALLDREGKLELKRILRIGMQAAEGLAAAHAQGLVHRDVKPANILLENGVERVKLTDFGLARAVHDAGVTQSGMLAGTPQYMAPEQASPGPLDHRADLFSLGSVLYAMGTGRPPFEGELLTVLKKVGEETPPPVRELNPLIPATLSDYIAVMMAKRPEDRPPTAAAVAAFLRGLLSGEPVSVPRRPRRWSWGHSLAVGIAMLACIAFLIYAWWPTSASPSTAGVSSTPQLSPSGRTPRTARIDFEAVDASGDTNGVRGAALTDYLATFGVTLRVRQLGPGPPTIQDKRPIAVQGKVRPLPSSGTNFFQGSQAYDLVFSRPLVRVSFTRVGQGPVPDGWSHPQWTVRALDSGGVEVAGVGEPLLSGYGELPPKRYTLSGPGIVQLRIDADGKNFAAYNSVLLDDLTLAWEE